MKIRFKVKHLLFSLVMVVLTGGILIPQAILSIGDQLVEKDQYAKAKALYRGYTGIPLMPLKEQMKLELAKAYVGNFDSKAVFATFSMGMAGNPVTQEDFAEGVKIFGDLAKNGRTKSIVYESYASILELTMGRMDREGLSQWIDWGQESSDESLRYLSAIYQSWADLANKKYQESANRVSIYADSPLRDERWDYLMTLLHQYEPTVPFQEATQKISTPEGRKRVNELIYGIEEYQREMMGRYRVSGRVLCDGEPMPFVHIIAETSLGGYSTRGYLPLAITDEQGYYTTLPLKKRTYVLGLDMPMGTTHDKVIHRGYEDGILSMDRDQVMNFNFSKIFPVRLETSKADKKQSEKKQGATNQRDENQAEKLQGDMPFRLIWEPVAGAAYYQVTGTAILEGKPSYFSTVITNQLGKTDLTQPIFETTIDHINQNNRAYSGNEKGPSPQNILGLIPPGAGMMFYVNAMDKQDRRINSSTAGIGNFGDLPKISYDRKPTQGESFILKKDYRQALDYYEKMLTEDPDSPKVLPYLIKYYSDQTLTWRELDKGVPPADPERAYELLMRYKSQLKSEGDLVNYLSRIEPMTLNQHREEVEKMLDTSGQSFDKDANEILGDMAKARGDLKLAYQYYQTIEEDYMQDRLSSYDIYFGDLDRGIQRLEKIRAWYSGGTKKERIDCLQGLKESVGTAEYKNLQAFMKKYLRRENFKDLSQEVMNLYQQTKDPHIRAYLKNLAQDYGIMDLDETK